MVGGAKLSLPFANVSIASLGSNAMALPAPANDANKAVNNRTDTVFFKFLRLL